MKKLVCLILSIFLMISCTNFEEEAKPLFKDLNSLYESSLEKCKITQEIWYTAIYDKKYALSTSNEFQDYYVSDFNVAIARMENEPSVKLLNSKINTLTSEAELKVGKTPKSKDDSYDKLIALYANIIELSKKAITPSGNLQSYSNDIKEMENTINKLITEIKARNPKIGL